MDDHDGESWKRLCEQAATEQDPDKLMDLINEIDRMLVEKVNSLKARPASPPEDAGLHQLNDC